MFRQVEGTCDRLPLKQSREAGQAALSQQMYRLRNHRLAGQPRRRITSGLVHGPAMMAIAAIKKGDQKSRVNERVCRPPASRFQIILL